MGGFYLRAQIIRHGRPIRLVGRVNIITEGFTGRVENHHQIIRRMLLHLPTQHVDDTVDSPRGFTTRGRQIRHGMVGPIKIGRPIDQHQFFCHYGISKTTFVIRRASLRS